MRLSCLVGFLTVALPTLAQGEDLSEALRLWKFTYQLELTAYGVQYMSRDLLLNAGDQLETAAGQTMITNSQMRVCLDATNELADYFRLSVAPVKGRERSKVRQEYETARAGCIRILGADPAQYPLGWPD